MTLASLLDELDRTASRRPGATAFERADGRVALTYDELVRRVADHANALHRAGLSPADRIAFGVRPGPGGMAWLLACFRAGLGVVILDPGVTPGRLASQCRAAGVTTVLLDPVVHSLAGTPVGRFIAQRTGVALPDPRRLAPRVWLTGRSLAPGAVVLSGRRRGRPATTAPQPPEPPPVAMDEEAPTLVVFTSGTTAEPRGVVHTPRSIAASVSTARELADLDEGARVVAAAPHFVVPTLLAGGTVVLPGFRERSIAGLARMTRRRNPTHVSLAPHAAVAWAEAGGAPATVRRVFLGSAPLRAAALRRILPGVPATCQVWGVYGLTEMLLVAAVRGEERVAHDERTGDLIGAPLGGASVRIDDDGEVLVSGPCQALGYLGQPPAVEVATGDVGRWLDGRLVLLGRRKEMLIRHGANIYPSLYERDVIDQAGLLDAALVGVPDALGDERAVLWIVPRAGDPPASALDRVDRLTRSPDGPLDVHARPDAIYPLDRMPRSGRSGKVDRRALSSLGAERLGLPDLRDPLLPVAG